MNKIWLIAKRDFKAYFTSPIGYIVIGAFAAIVGYFFVGGMIHFSQAYKTYLAQNIGRQVSITDGVVRPIFANMNVILLFFVPFITSRLFAEERKSHTLEILLTSPVSLWHIILAKFLSAMGLVLAMLLGTAVFTVILFMTGNPDPGPIFASYVGTILMTAGLVSVGIFFSSMTENQIVAGALTFGTFLLLWVINWFSGNVGPVFSDVLNYLSVIQHFGNFGKGIINSSDVIFYISLCFVALFMTHRVLDSFRWRA